jgi:hypothetical protein
MATRLKRADGQRRLELGAVAGLATGQMEVERVAVEVGLEVDFGLEPTARSAERLALLPLFAPAAETWARGRAVEELDQVRGLTACPGSPRLDWTASNTSSTIDHSRSVIRVSMSGSLLPVTQ